VLGVSLKCRGAELEGPGLDGDSEAGRRCLTTGRNNVPPFSGRTRCQWIASFSGAGSLTNAGRHDDRDQIVYLRPLPILSRSLTPSSLELISEAASWQTSGCQRPRNLRMTLDRKEFALFSIGNPISRLAAVLTETRHP